MRLLAAFALLALLATPVDAAARKTGRPVAAKRAVPVKKSDWTRRVVVTPDGGFLVGNPAAKAKLVEYGSLSCPYCGQFYADAHAPLMARVAAGNVSFEFRPLAVHSADPILHGLLRCAGPANFRRFFDDFYTDQATLAGAYETWVEANPTTNPNAGAAARIKYAGDWGFTKFATAHGVPASRIAACLSDDAALKAQQAREDKAATLGVQGTPTFFLNDQPTGARWAEIDAAISAIVGPAA